MTATEMLDQRDFLLTTAQNKVAVADADFSSFDAFIIYGWAKSGQVAQGMNMQSKLVITNKEYVNKGINVLINQGISR